MDAVCSHLAKKGGITHVRSDVRVSCAHSAHPLPPQKKTQCRLASLDPFRAALPPHPSAPWHVLQVQRALLSPEGHWLLEGALRAPIMGTAEERKQQPAFTPWNLGVFDALVLADKMVGCTGGSQVPVQGARREGRGLPW